MLILLINGNLKKQSLMFLHWKCSILPSLNINSNKKEETYRKKKHKWIKFNIQKILFTCQQITNVKETRINRFLLLSKRFCLMFLEWSRMKVFRLDIVARLNLSWLDCFRLIFTVFLSPRLLTVSMQLSSWKTWFPLSLSITLDSNRSTVGVEVNDLFDL